MGRIRYNWKWGLLCACLLAVAVHVYRMLFVGVEPGPPLVARLQASQVLAGDIGSVEILRFDPGKGWPFRERDYDRLESFEISDRSRIEEMVSLIASGSSSGDGHRNHPTTFHYGILRINLRKGRCCYIYYSLQRDQGGCFAHLSSNSEGSTNPNGAKPYENTMIVDWFRRVDPWFHGPGGNS